MPQYINLNLPNSKIIYFPNFFNKKDSDYYFSKLKNLSDWDQLSCVIFGKKKFFKRLNCAYSNNGSLKYYYTGRETLSKKFPNFILEIKKKIEKFLCNEFKFNFCLLNYYRNGKDYISMHSDNIKNLEESSLIVSISFGEKRKFKIHNKDGYIKKNIILDNGSLLIMDLKMQKYYKHGISIENKKNNGRISLTFRQIKK